MSFRGLLRWSAVLALWGGGVLVVAQSSVPSVGLSANGAAPAPVALPEHRPQVSLQQGRLIVLADNSSLNQILREIARVTGMSISGSVMDEKVFGTYGPGAPAEILAALLAGTRCNMMLRESANNAPAELVLTPVLGRPTPPDASAARLDSVSPRAEFSAPPPVRQPAAPVNSPELTSTPRAEALPEPQPAPTLSSAASNLAGQPAPGSQPQSPNGVATPQQIYQQLQQLQQAQQQPAAQ